MLHQYTSQQYSNLNSHYSPLDNCSHLLERTFLQPTKLTELEDCVVQQNGFYMEDKFQSELENECQTYDSTPQEVPAEDDEAKALVPTSVCELLDRHQPPAADAKDCDTKTSQLINDEQNNNHVQKSPIKNESYDYQKYDSSKEENELLPFINLDVDTLINAAEVVGVPNDTKLEDIDDNDLKQKIQQLTADELRALCEDSESGFRLPGFHQAFGSTEIGRYVHPKDFIEQIASPPIIPASQLQPHPAALRPTGSNVLNGPGHHPNGAKMKSRYQKRGKAALPPPAPPLPAPTAEDSRNSCWNYESPPAPPDGTTCLPNNGTYYKQRKDLRRSKSGPMAADTTMPHPAYYNGSGTMASSVAAGAEEYYCSSSYYGSCADYTNCEYYRYQQSSQYPSNYPASPVSCSSYSHSGYGSYNSYTDEHCQRLQPYNSCASAPAATYMAGSGSGHHGQGWRGERFFPYGDQFPYGRYKQNGGSSPYNSVYQNYVGSQSQYLQSAQQYQSYGYNAHPPVGQGLAPLYLWMEGEGEAAPFKENESS